MLPVVFASCQSLYLSSRVQQIKLHLREVHFGKAKERQKRQHPFEFFAFPHLLTLDDCRARAHAKHTLSFLLFHLIKILKENGL